MNYCQFSVKNGSVLFEWNEEGRWSGIRLLDFRSPQPLSKQYDLCLTPSLPSELVPWIEHFRAYFDEGKPFGSVPWELLDLSGCTEFQKKVYQAASEIPFGETRTYSWVAERIRRLGASRAVGQALKRNPFPVLLPCHRVITSLGAVGGFMGMSQPHSPEAMLKKSLIQIEEHYVSPFFSFLTPSTETYQLCS